MHIKQYISLIFQPFELIVNQFSLKLQKKINVLRDASGVMQDVAKYSNKDFGFVIIMSINLKAMRI